MTMDDDDLEDPALGSLRSVLRGMRDEEPSDRGLASLMAAARAQAEVMKPAPAWWERVLATLRRPPVLALASAALLVSGGLVISRHARELDATSSAPAAIAPVDDIGEGARVSSGAGEGPALGEGAGSGASLVPGPGGSPPLETTPAPSALPRPPGHDNPDDMAGAPPSSAEALRSPATAGTGTRGAAPAGSRPARVAPAGGASATAPHDQIVPRAASVPALIESDAEAIRHEPEPSPEAPVPGGLGQATSDHAGAASPAAPRPTVSAAQLQDWATRCEQAAERGDCATVRTLARQVQAAAPEVFRLRLRVNSMVARCLAP